MWKLTKNCTSALFLVFLHMFFLDLTKSFKYVQQLRFHTVLDCVLVQRQQMQMAMNCITKEKTKMFFRQLYYLLYKNAYFKYHHKLQALAEILVISSAIVFFCFPVVIWNKVLESNDDVIPSSEQMIYNASKKPDEKRQHLAFVTTINASEFQFCL